MINVVTEGSYFNGRCAECGGGRGGVVAVLRLGNVAVVLCPKHYEDLQKKIARQRVKDI